VESVISIDCDKFSPGCKITVVNNRAAYTRLRKKAESANGFSRRILERKLKWWTNPYNPSDWRYYPKQLDKIKLRLTTRRSDDPEESWHCCEPWPRLLINKINSRAFVQRFGIPVPELYWSGRWLNGFSWHELPDRYAIRPAWGAGRKGVHVVADGRELLADGNRDAARELIKRRLITERGNFNPVPLLFEEAILQGTDPPRLPLEYKCHVFGDTVGAIQTISRGASGTEFHSRYLDPNWRPFGKRMLHSSSQLPVGEPPVFLGQIKSWCKAMGSTLGTYIRIDFLGTEKRCVFNEFSSIPGIRYNSPYLDEVFEELWHTHIPNED